MKLLMILPFLLFMSCSSKNTQALEQDTEHSKDMIGVTSSYITELRTKML